MRSWAGWRRGRRRSAACALASGSSALSGCVAIPLLAECVVSLVFTGVLICHQQLQHACCVAALSRLQKRWPFLSGMPPCDADVSHRAGLCVTDGALGLAQVLGSYQFQAAAAPSLATLRGVPLSNGRDLTTRLSDFPRLRHLHAAGGSPALRFAELPPSLRVGYLNHPVFLPCLPGVAARCRPAAATGCAA